MSLMEGGENDFSGRPFPLQWLEGGVESVTGDLGIFRSTIDIKSHLHSVYQYV